VQLFATNDLQKGWSLIQRRRPDQGAFDFIAPNDGPYWFATRTITDAGGAFPAGNIAPQLHVLVDRKGPIVDVHASTEPNGDVRLDLLMEDTAASENPLRIDYMTDSHQGWANVEIPIGALHSRPTRGGGNRINGNLLFTPPRGWQKVVVRVTGYDAANNQSVSTHSVGRPRIAERPTTKRLAKRRPGAQPRDGHGLPATVLPGSPSTVVTAPLLTPKKSDPTLGVGRLYYNPSAYDEKTLAALRNAEIAYRATLTEANNDATASPKTDDDPPSLAKSQSAKPQSSSPTARVAARGELPRLADDDPNSITLAPPSNDSVPRQTIPARFPNAGELHARRSVASGPQQRIADGR
ncbi:MAG: hypothetical protein AAFP69_24135, partial [Planctomycetota bacterium]